MKTAELQGRALDWAVANCAGFEVELGIWESLWIVDRNVFGERRCVQGDDGSTYHPSQNWAQAGPIIEQEKMDFKWVGINTCRAAIDWLDEKSYEAFGHTPLIAAMHCYVTSKLGAEVELPDFFLKGN